MDDDDDDDSPTHMRRKKHTFLRLETLNWPYYMFSLLNHHRMKYIKRKQSNMTSYFNINIETKSATKTTHCFHHYQSINPILIKIYSRQAN